MENCVLESGAEKCTVSYFDIQYEINRMVAVSFCPPENEGWSIVVT